MNQRRKERLPELAWMHGCHRRPDLRSTDRPVGFGGYRAIRSGLSKAARRIAVGLVVAAIAFSLVVVSWDIVDGTSTSTESFVVLVIGVPLLMALAAVKVVDRVARGQRQHHT